LDLQFELYYTTIILEEIVETKKVYFAQAISDLDTTQIKLALKNIKKL